MALKVSDSRPDYLTSVPEYKLKPKVFHCLNDRVLIRPIEDAKKVSEGGIDLPEQYIRQPFKGTVVAVAPNIQDGEQLIGLVAYYSEYTPEEFEFNGEKLALLRFADIRGYETE
jgi:co-chaperonin GroES (HSP10)